MTLQGKIFIDISSLAPIIGITFVNPADKATWVVNYQFSATQPQKDAVVAYLASVNVATLQARLTADENDRAALIANTAIMALVDQDQAAWGTWATANFPTLTAAERTRLANLFWVVSIGVRERVRPA